MNWVSAPDGLRCLSHQGCRGQRARCVESMVERLRAKPGSQAVAVTIGDMADLPVEGTYPRVYVIRPRRAEGGRQTVAQDRRVRRPPDRLQAHSFRGGLPRLHEQEGEEARHQGHPRLAQVGALRQMTSPLCRGNRLGAAGTSCAAGRRSSAQAARWCDSSKGLVCRGGRTWPSRRLLGRQTRASSVTAAPGAHDREEHLEGVVVHLPMSGFRLVPGTGRG